MKSIITLITEAKEMKDKKIMPFKEFRSMFFAEEPENLNKYWSIAIDMYINDNFDAGKCYVKKYDREPKVHTEYLGKQEHTKQLDKDVRVTIYTNGAYIENQNKYVVLAEKSLINVI